MEIIKEKTCCFTGHRPEKLKGSEKNIRQQLRMEITKMIKDGVDTFISGMQAGVDLWAADIICRMKEKNGDLKLVCAVAFPGMETKFSEKDKKKFTEILEAADRVEYIVKAYAKGCFYERDRWMVDRSARMIAVYNGTPGGTKYTIEYAREKGIEPVIIEDKEGTHCSICGKQLDMWDLQENFSYDDIPGYGSRFDCCHIRFRLCCGCFDKMIDGIRRHGKEDPVICTDVRFAGEMTNEQARRLNKVCKYTNLAGADAIVARIAKMNSEEIEAEIRKLEEAFGVES